MPRPHSPRPTKAASGVVVRILDPNSVARDSGQFVNPERVHAALVQFVVVASLPQLLPVDLSECATRHVRYRVERSRQRRFGG